MTYKSSKDITIEMPLNSKNNEPIYFTLIQKFLIKSSKESGQKNFEKKLKLKGTLD